MLLRGRIDERPVAASGLARFDRIYLVKAMMDLEGEVFPSLSALGGKAVG